MYRQRFVYPNQKLNGGFDGVIGIEVHQRWYKISDLNSELNIFLLHEGDDVSWLTIDESCGLAVVSYKTWYWQNSGNNTAGPIIPEIRIHCFIRYLADGSYLGIFNLVSIPHSTFYYILRKTCDAINDCP